MKKLLLTKACIIAIFIFFGSGLQAETKDLVMASSTMEPSAQETESKADDQPYPVTFHVTNQASQPVENALVTVYASSRGNNAPVQLKRSFAPLPENSGRPASASFIAPGVGPELSDNTTAGKKPFYPGNDRSGEWIRYWQEGVNENALGLGGDGAQWFAAIRWMPEDLGAYEGYAVSKIRVFMNDEPDNGFATIWQGDIDNPVVMRSQEFIPVQEDWVEIVLDQPYAIDTSQELWIGWEIGDPGDGVFPAAFEIPMDDANDGLADLLQFGDNPWQYASSLGFPANWNIEAWVESAETVVAELHTDANGQASFDAFTGNYYYTVEKEEHDGAQGSFNVSNQPVDVSVNLFSYEEFPAVTFYIDMTYAEGFDPAQHDVYLTGSFTGWAEPGSPGSLQMNLLYDKSPPFHFYENFESYEDFTTDLSPWTTLQLTEGQTWGVADWDFPGEGTEFAWMAFNPSLTDPPTDELNPPIDGSKMGMAIQYMDIDDDKWLISPEVSIHHTSELSFWARSYTHAYGPERIRVLVSTTGTDPASFTPISPHPYIEVPVEWTEYSFDLGDYSGETIHFAIHYMSEDAFIFWIDAISLTAMVDFPDELIYTVTTAIPEGQHEYQYFSNAFGDGWDGGEWPGQPFREITVTGDMEVHDIWGYLDPVEGFTVNFSVIDEFGDPIDHAIITLGGTTNQPGDYVFHDVPEGTHAFHVAGTCYMPEEGEMHVIHDFSHEVQLDIDHMPGDANGDGIVNVLDIILMGNHYLDVDMDVFCFHNADVNGDGLVNILDMIATINIFISKTTAPYSGLKSDDAHLHFDASGVSITSDGTLAGIQLEFSGSIPAELIPLLDIDDFEIIYRVKNNRVRMMIFSFDNKPIPAGKTRLVSFNREITDIEWMDGLAGNLNAEEVPLLADNDQPTGVEESEGLAFKAYPNPADNSLWVEFRNTDSASLSLINVHAQVVKTQTVDKQGQQTIRLDLADLPRGVYLLRLDHAGSYLVERIVLR